MLMKNVRILLLLGFIFIILIVSINAIFTFQIKEHGDSKLQWVMHTHDIILETKQFLSAMKDTETGQRGYLLTLDKAYLEVYNSGIINAKSSFQRLQTLTKDNPSQQESLKGIHRLMVLKLDELLLTINLANTQAIEIVKQDHGKEYMDKIRASVEKFNQVELSLLKKRQIELEQYRENLLWLIEIISFIVFSILFYFIYTTVKQKNNLSESFQKLKLLQESLENQNMLLQKIIDLAPVRMFWKDMDGVYLGANKQFVEDAQLNDVSQIIGKTDYDMTWKDSAQQFREDDAAVIKSGISQLQYEEELPTEDGGYIYVVTSKVPLRDIHDNIIGILGVYNDITESKLLQKEAKEKDKQLLMQSRMAQMGEMISMIAHQWRQPLSAISATAADLKIKLELETFDLSVQSSLDEFNNYFINSLENMEGYTVSLSNTINDFRNFYKPNKDTQSIKLEDILNKALSIIESSMRSDKIEIITNRDCKQELEVHDGELMHVFINILKNTQDNFNEKNIENPRLIIDVKDTEISFTDNGGGIPEDILEKIFDPYFSTKDEKNGTGLGLYMSKQIVEDHHDGKIDALNTDNGVCFRVNLGESES